MPSDRDRCVCPQPAPQGVWTVAGEAVALICDHCRRPFPERRRYPQGLLEAARASGVDAIVLDDGDVVDLDDVEAELRAVLEALVLSDGGASYEHVERTA